MPVPTAAPMAAEATPQPGPDHLQQHARHAQLPAQFCSALQQLFGERCSFSAALCAQHGRDESSYPAMPPQAVVFAHTALEVSDLLRLCQQWQVPLIPWGAGSSLEGHLLAIEGGVCLDLSEMQAIVQVSAEDMTATVQAGVTREALNAHLRDSGLFFAVDPGANATLGGMAATRASGTNAVRYGTMRENVLALQVVLADGSIIKTGSHAKKSSSGYDLTHFFIGSEGTLGVMTELTVRLHPQPAAVAVASCSFADTSSAIECVIACMQQAIPLARIEFLDQQCARALNARAQLQLPEQPLLLFEFHGSEAAVSEQTLQVQEITQEYGGSAFAWAREAEQRKRLWAARHQAYFALLQMKPGARAITTDCCVPISQLAAVISATEADCRQTNLPSSIIGHVGDGNFHLLLLVEDGNPEQITLAEEINTKIVARTLAARGTCSGEHGIGLHKKRFMLDEHGAPAVAFMRHLKHSCDPLNILNPGKILPDPG